jgi:Arc/MetJ-type ribon-helix-helix transcriptional regulator
MPRTTIDIDAPLLAEIKGMQGRDGKRMSEVVREALSRYLAEKERKHKPPLFSWIARPMALKVDLADKDAVHAVIEEPAGGAR